MLYRFGVFILFLTYSLSCLAQDTITFVGDKEITKIKNARSFLDTTCELRLSQVLQELNKKQEVYNEKNHCYWEEIIIKNVSSKNDLILEFGNPHIDKIDIYKEVNGVFTHIHASGFGRPISERSIAHKNHTFILNIPSNHSQRYLIKFQDKLRSGFQGVLKPTESFIGYSLSESVGLGVFYGVLLLLLVYNLVLYFTDKRKYYLFYIIYIICCSIVSFNENGLGFLYLWPSSIKINYVLYSYGSILLCFSFLFYSVSFYGRKVFSNKRIVLISSYLILTYVIFDFFNLEKLSPISYSIFYLSIFYCTSNRFKTALKSFSFFEVGNIILVISFLILQLRVSNVLSSNIYTVYFFNFGFIIEGIIFSYAMANKLKSAHDKIEQVQEKMILELKEKELLKDKVNRELEIAVSKRTTEVELQKQELLALNKELKVYQEKIDYINSELDKDNWKLQKSLSEAKKEKILKRVSTYLEFCEVFKSNFECINHLIELKWNDGFKCKKCKSQNYMLVAQTKKRKCTNCKHIESPTANTIFHGVKFPLSKAFYLVYLTHHNKKNNTIDELSLELDLRRNTLWAFRKKVQEKRDLLIDAKKIKENSPWEHIIIN